MIFGGRTPKSFKQATSKRPNTKAPKAGPAIKTPGQVYKPRPGSINAIAKKFERFIRD